MFSQLGPLFKNTFRQAEANDARQSIPHDERDQRKRKRDEGKKETKNNNLWEDNTTVSVNALRAFLINFLKTMPGEEKATTTIENTPDQPRTSPSENNKFQANTANARAVKAYQVIADTTPATPVPQKKPSSEDSTKPTADLLQSKEIRDIHGLIDDLDSLAQRGIQDLRILRADSFLTSLKNAVLIAKSKI